jgi:hypothetical protein
LKLTVNKVTLKEEMEQPGRKRSWKNITKKLPHDTLFFVSSRYRAG